MYSAGNPNEAAAADVVTAEDVLWCALEGCGEPVDEEGHLYCSMWHFRLGVRILRAENRKAGLCPCGQARDGGFLSCAGCRSRRRVYERRRRERVRAERVRAAVGGDVVFVPGDRRG